MVIWANFGLRASASVDLGLAIVRKRVHGWDSIISLSFYSLLSL